MGFARRWFLLDLRDLPLRCGEVIFPASQLQSVVPAKAQGRRLARTSVRHG